MVLRYKQQCGFLKDLEAKGSPTLPVGRAIVLAAGANEPSHIHEGTCANPNPAPAFPLSNVRDEAETRSGNRKLEPASHSTTQSVGAPESR